MATATATAMAKNKLLAMAAMFASLTPALASAQSNVSVGGTSGADEARALAQWIDETNAVLRSPELRRNLLSLQRDFPLVYTAHDNSNTIVLRTVRDVADILMPGAGYRYVPIPIALTGGTYDFTATAGWTGYADAAGQSLGSMTLGRGHLVNWLSGDVVQRSCAVNTLAHEQSHSISNHAKFYNMVFLDEGRRAAAAGVPAASYLIGSAVQCTWLQKRGRVSADGFAACVQVFGSRHFNSLRCTRFNDGQPVVDRPDLPAPATD